MKNKEMKEKIESLKIEKKKLRARRKNVSDNIRNLEKQILIDEGKRVACENIKVCGNYVNAFSKRFGINPNNRKGGFDYFDVKKDRFICYTCKADEDRKNILKQLLGAKIEKVTFHDWGDRDQVGRIDFSNKEIKFYIEEDEHQIYIHQEDEL